MSGPWNDFIGEFLELTEDTISPLIFRKWSAIAAVAGALERRVWARTKGGVLFPNLYTLFVAPPGVGKYVLEDVQEFMREVCEPGTKSPAFCIAPSNVSKASLLDTLVKSGNRKLLPQAPPIVYHSLMTVAEEFSVLLPAYDLEYIGVLTKIYNNVGLYDEERRASNVKSLKIEFPQLNIVAGTQPGWLASTFPEEAWSTGLASRLMMVYSGEKPKTELFWDSIEQADEHERLRLLARARCLRSLAHISQLYGQMQWSFAAVDRLQEWNRGGQLPVPQHSKLLYYNNRRQLHLLKLCIVSAIASTCKLIIELSDVERAMSWMNEAELLMPDIFRAMVGRSDTQVIEELHLFVMQMWNRGGKKAIPERMLFAFLQQRVPSDKIEKIITIAERSNIIARVVNTDMYIPKPRVDFGVE